MRLQVALRDARQRDAVVVAVFDDRVAVGVGRDERGQLLDILQVGEVFKLDRIGLRIEVDDRVGANAGREYGVGSLPGPPIETDIVPVVVSAGFCAPGGCIAGGSLTSAPPLPSTVTVQVALVKSPTRLTDSDVPPCVWSVTVSVVRVPLKLVDVVNVSPACEFNPPIPRISTGFRWAVSSQRRSC